MNEKILSIALELLVLCGLAAIYYFWQRNRILYGPRRWHEKKLVEAFQLALAHESPEKFSDMEEFLSDTQERLNSDAPWMNGEYIRRWHNANLPPAVKELMSECKDWWDQSQPKTR